MSALVTDADLDRCYTVARSLARSGIRVTVAGEEKHKNVAFYSKYCHDRILYPSPDKHNEFIKCMLRAVVGHDVLIPLHERTIVPLSRNMDQFENTAKIPIPEYKRLCIALDKGKTIELAHRLGIPTPSTYLINDLKELSSLSKRIRYPVVIKLRREKDTPPPRYIYVFSPKSLLREYQSMHRKCRYPLIQELIPGSGYGFFSLLNKDSKPLAVFCHRRIREYPITGGVSTYCESIYEPRIIDYGLKILKEIKWHGVAMVEFRKDFRDGEFKLMEVNPRFWGSLPLAIASGVDFPYLLFRMAIGKGIAISKYRIGVRCRFLRKDLLALKQALEGTGEKTRYLKAFLSSFLDKNLAREVSSEDLKLAGYRLLNAIRDKLPSSL